jgi:hypothetical protein
MKTTIAKRGRGRPPGSSRLNAADDAQLGKVADLIVNDPMPPTRAMRRLGIHGEAETRRLQRKWKAAGRDHLRGAQERRLQKNGQATAPAAERPLARGGYDAEVAASLRYQTTIRAALDLFDSPSVKAAQAILNDPVLRTALVLAGGFDSAVQKAVLDYATNPIHQAARKLGEASRLEQQFRELERVNRFVQDAHQANRLTRSLP